MDGRDTIIITLKCYFHASDNKILQFNEVCNVLLYSLTDETYDETLLREDLDAEISTLARVFSSGSYQEIATIENDLCRILINWRDTVKWAQDDLQALMEKDDLLADLAKSIVDDIMNDSTNSIMKRNYKPDILHALLEKSAPSGYYIDPYVRQRLPRNIDLDTILQAYQRLSRKHGFGREVHLLLHLLFDKMNRNSNRHAFFIVQKYRLYCRKSRTQPSFHDYISYRGLTIPPQLSVHCERLFRNTYKI